jgi:hypothetical protein
MSTATQTVNLWIANTQEHYQAALELLDISTNKYDFAQRLKMYIEDELYLSDAYNQHFINDMLTEALSQVSWVQISDDFWSEYKETA